MDARAPSGATSEGGNVNHIGDGAGKEEMQDGEKGTEQWKGTPDVYSNAQGNGKGKGKAMEEWKGKGKGNGKGKGTVKQTPGGDDISHAAAMNLH